MNFYNVNLNGRRGLSKNLKKMGQLSSPVRVQIKNTCCMKGSVNGGKEDATAASGG
jgi:hypothetical protein